MAAQRPPGALAIDARDLNVGPFTQVDGKIGGRQLFATLALLMLDFRALAWAIHADAWLLAVPLYPAGALLLVRSAVLAHDCAHGTLFRSRPINDWVGRVLGLLWWLPYWYWRDDHLSHHASCGNLDRRGLGDIDVLTVGEYRGLSRPGRWAYRIIRHPLTLFCFGPPLYFFLRMRVVAGPTRRRRRAWRSVIATNGALLLAVPGVGLTAGWDYVLWCWIPCLALATPMAAWLFYVQHQFPEVYWRRSGEWSYMDGAFAGSTHFDLPRWLAWFSADIGHHDIHHLFPRIPNHRLHECWRTIPELRTGRRVGLWEAFAFSRLALYDETRKRLVSFAEVSTRMPGSQAHTR